jgi:hypothetical protein
LKEDVMNEPCTLDDLKELAQYLRARQLEERYPGFAQMSATRKVRALIDEQRRKNVPEPPDTMGEVLRIQQARGQR